MFPLTDVSGESDDFVFLPPSVSVKQPPPAANKLWMFTVTTKTYWKPSEEEGFYWKGDNLMPCERGAFWGFPVLLVCYIGLCACRMLKSLFLQREFLSHETLLRRSSISPGFWLPSFYQGLQRNGHWFLSVSFVLLLTVGQTGFRSKGTVWDLWAFRAIAWHL